MQGTYARHLTLLQFLNRTPGQEELVGEYQRWLRQGFHLSYDREEEAWERWGQNLLAQISVILGETGVQAILKEEHYD